MKTQRWLPYTLTLLVAVLVPAAVFAQEENLAISSAPGDSIDYEPVISVEVIDTAFAAPSISNLTIWDDGHAVYFDGSGMCQADLSKDQMHTIYHGIRLANASELYDQRVTDENSITGMPFTTVTVFLKVGPSGHALANTFSYYQPVNRYKRLQDAVDQITSFLSPCN